MNKKINLTAIDTQITPIIHAVQYDTDRYLDCYFEDIDITGVSSARIYAKKPDDTEVYNDCVIQNGYITAPLTSQTLAVVGKVNCQLQLVIDGTLTSFAFTVIVDESLVSSSAIPSSNEYTALESLIAEAESVIDGLPTKVSKSGDSMSGTLDMTDNKIVNLGTPTADADAATKEYVDDAVGAIPVITVDSALSDTSENPVQNKVVKSAIDGKLSLSGGTMTGNVDFDGHKITNASQITISTNLVVGNMSVSGNKITGLQTPPTANSEATSKQYVDDADALNEKLANKVTAISSASTDDEYPSAKCVYDAIDAVPIITVDSALDTQSTNPVENGVITTALGGKLDTSGGVITGAVTLNGALSVNGNLNMNNRQINNLAAPAYATSAVNKKYVDDLVGDINTILATLATP